MSENNETYESVVQQRDELEKKLADVVAEAESIKSRMQLLVDIVNNADNSYCMCGSAMKDHGIYGCGSPTGMFDYHYGKWIESEDETPATDAYLALIKSEAQSEVIEWLDAEITAIDTMYRGDPSYEHDAYWMKSEVIDVVELARKAFSVQLRKGIDDAQ